MKIIFSRHGNTFSVGETAFWIGADEDLPLTDTGVEQAKNLANVIQKINLKITAVYCSPLKRTKDYAKIILNKLNSPLKPTIDHSLNEISYGKWAGLNNLEIKAIGAMDELTAWENSSQWPKKSAWSGSPEFILDEIKVFMNSLIKKYSSSDTVLIITSNGKLRYFLQLVPGAFEEHIQNNNFKVKTGNICLFIYDSDKWNIKFWNKNPEYLLDSHLLD